MNQGERQLMSLLRSRYPADRWALLPTVVAATWAAGNHADAIAVALWPSLGPVVHGFEIKVSRTDWQRELRQPGKSDPVGRFCNYWWLVTPALSVARPDELPEGWGWLSAERPKRSAIEQAAIEQSDFEEPGFGFLSEVDSALTPSPPPRVEAADITSLSLFTVKSAPRREAAAPSFDLLVSVFRRAQAQLLGEAPGQGRHRGGYRLGCSCANCVAYEIGPRAEATG